MSWRGEVEDRYTVRCRTCGFEGRGAEPSAQAEVPDRELPEVPGGPTRLGGEAPVRVRHRGTAAAWRSGGAEL